jgi:hypothetical protein
VTFHRLISLGWKRHSHMAMTDTDTDKEIDPFRVDVPAEALADWLDRLDWLDRTRWTPEPEPAGADCGMTVAVMRPLAEYWRICVNSSPRSAADPAWSHTHLIVIAARAAHKGPPVVTVCLLGSGL